MLISATSSKSDFEIVFQPEIELGNLKREIAFFCISATNSIPNVTESANAFEVKVSGRNSEMVSMPTGSYGFKAIQRYFKASAKARLEANQATFHTVIEVPANTIISFDVPNSIASVLGFERKNLATGMHISDHVAKIVPVNTVNICCDVVTGSWVDGNLANSLFTFYPDVAPGAKIVKEARQLMYLPFADKRKETLTRMRIKIMDQDSNVIDFRGEPITLTFFLR